MTATTASVSVSVDPSRRLDALASPEGALGRRAGQSVPTLDVVRGSGPVRPKPAASLSPSESTWLSGLAHELGGTVHALSLFLELASRSIEARDGQGTRARDHVECARRSARMLARLVEDLAYAGQADGKRSSVRLAPVDMTELVVELGRELTKTIGARHTLLVHAEPGLRCETDPDRVRQILSNLVTNAVKYGAPGVIEIGLRREGSTIAAWVRDEGPGIAPADQARLFAPFVRLVKDARGSGLGLWLSRELATDLGGSLELVSDVNRPTTLTLRLPAA